MTSGFVLRVTCKICVCLAMFLHLKNIANAQELFPYTESANTLSKGTFNYRIGAEYYKDLQSYYKYQYMLRTMYGFTPRFTGELTVSGSNHHVKDFPKGYAAYFLNHHTRYNSNYKFLFEGFHLLLKYRLMNWDGQRKHLRIATYAEGSTSRVAHDEAEPNLIGDNAGYGGGIVATALYHRLAISWLGGIVSPLSYPDKASDLKFTSGNMLSSNLSFGFLLYPAQYRSYEDINISFYTEFIYRNYGAATLTQKKNIFDLADLNQGESYTYHSLQRGQYCDLRTSLQFVFNSISRLDVGLAWQLWNISYVHTYPVLARGYQRIIYPRPKLKKY
jgi:hypothetical protein